MLVSLASFTASEITHIGYSLGLSVLRWYLDGILCGDYSVADCGTRYICKIAASCNAKHTAAMGVDLYHALPQLLAYLLNR